MKLTPLFKKLNLKNQKQILVLNHPTEFEEELTKIKGFTEVKIAIQDVSEIEFLLAFVKEQQEIETLTPSIDEKLKGDGTVWYAYPKKTSKKYKSEINRDSGWETLGNFGYEAVRQVAIDSDWSALRFRKVEFIKTMKRRTSFALTEKGKEKTKK